MCIETTGWDLETRYISDKKAYILMMPFFFPFYRTFRIVRAAKIETVCFVRLAIIHTSRQQQPGHLCLVLKLLKGPKCEILISWILMIPMS